MHNAQRLLKKCQAGHIARIEALIGVKVSILSTGPDRNETIILEHPFA
jgi:adenylosuccinate synthase